MMERTYRLKTVVGETTIRDMLMASNVEDAIMQFMETHRSQLLHVKGLDSGRRHELCYIAKVEVDGEETYLGRYFYAGIGRKGGVQRLDPLLCGSLKELASKLDVEPSNLESSGWEGEESYEQAQSRRRQEACSRREDYQDGLAEDDGPEADREDIRRQQRVNRVRQTKQEMDDMGYGRQAVQEAKAAR